MQNILDPVLSYWRNPLARTALILTLAFLAAFFFRLIVLRLVHALTRKTHTELDDELLEALRTPIFTSVLLVGISYAAAELELSEHLTYIVQGTLKSVAVIVWGMAAMHIGAVVLKWLAGISDAIKVVQPSTLPLFQIIYKLTVFGAIVYFAFISWNIDVTGWLASAGIVGIAVGFAAKDTLANLFAGIFIVTDAPYQLGDFIILNGKDRGVVTNIGIRSTRILTRDDIEITVPNAMIANSQVVNETGGRHPKRRVRIQVGVAYGSDIAKVREVLFQCAAETTHVCKDPEPRVHFTHFGDSALNFQLKMWIDEPVYKGRATDQVLTLIHDKFAVAGIEFPFPKRDIYIKEMPSGKT